MPGFAAVKKLKVKPRILQLLKVGGPQSAAALAAQLQVSPMAVRQHLQHLQAEGWVSYQQQRQPVGRPLKLWQLTEPATQLFPDRYGELLLNLLQSIEQVFGHQGLEQLLAHRTLHQTQTYTAQLATARHWQAQVAGLAELRTQEGYMAQVIQESAKSVLLVENHCPIRAAAQQCQQFCSSELEVFTALLGPGVKVERVAHLLQGDRCCTYRIAVNSE